MTVPPGKEEPPGLPGVESWPAMYLWVAVSFVTWVVLLMALSRYNT
jgi:hypothetical protein